MSQLVTGIRTQEGVSKIDYNSLANKPEEKFSTADKTKLEGIEKGANKTTIVDNLTSTSATSALSAKQASNLVPKTRKVNNKSLSSDITLTASDVGAFPKSGWTEENRSRVVIINKDGVATISLITTEELGYLDDVTSNIQTQINSKAPSTHSHSASAITSGALAMKNGGTGATTGKAGLKNLFAAGATILSSYQFGDELPTDDYTAGRIFFKKV